MKEDEFRLYRRKLPHWRMERGVYFVTWRLGQDQADLMPAERGVVAEALLHFHNTRYRLAGYVIMNDHVHVIVEPGDAQRLEAIVPPGNRSRPIALYAGGREKAAYGKGSTSTAFCEVNWKWPRSFNTCRRIRGSVGRRPGTTLGCGLLNK
jgi:hypothetical protein